MSSIFELCKNKELKLFRDKSMILVEGIRSNNFYVLANGEIKVIKKGKNIANINTKGSLIGEISAILKVPYTATCQACGDVSMYEINVDDLSLEKNADLLLIIAKELCIKLYRTTNSLTEVVNDTSNYTLSNAQLRDLRIMDLMSNLYK